VFAALALLTVSVVDARRPLDREVTTSFEAVLLKATGDGSRVRFLGCPKASIDYYDCRAVVPRGLGGATVTYRLWLTDDRCWTADFRMSPARIAAVPGRARLEHLRGCLAPRAEQEEALSSSRSPV
jgi:hypothetical protein